MIDYTKIQLNSSIRLFPWEQREEASAIDIIHHKNKETLESYDFLFNAYDKKINSIFEIGVKNGGSLALWNLVFPNAKILGIDLDIKQVSPTTIEYLKSKGIEAVECNCLEVPRVNQIIESTLGEVDLIIDDGQHTFETIIPSIKNFWKYLTKGGFYVIEDWDSFNREHLDQLLSMLTEFLMDDWEAHQKMQSKSPHSIHLLRNFIAIAKQ